MSAIFSALKRALVSRLGRLRRSPVSDPADRRRMQELNEETRRVLADYREGRISAPELRAWIAEHDPADMRQELDGG